MSSWSVLRNGVELRKIDAPDETTALTWARKRWGNDVTVEWAADVNIEPPEE